MVMKRVTGAVKYFKYTECEEGQVLVDGHYLGEREGKFGKEHEFRDLNGELVVLNSSGHLNYLIDKHLSEGGRVKVIYGGETVLTSGKFVGKRAHRFELEVDDEDAGGAPAKKKKSSGATGGKDKAPWEEEESVTFSEDDLRV